MTKRIFRAIFVACVSIFALCVIVVSWVMYSTYSESVSSMLDSQLETVSYGVKTNGTAWLTGFAPDDFRITLIDSDGSVLFDTYTDADSMGDHSDAEEVSLAFATGSGQSERYSETLGGQAVYKAILLDDGTVLRICTPKKSFASIFIETSGPIILLLLLVISVSIIFAYRLSNVIVKPLEKLDLDSIPEKAPYEELRPFLLRIERQRTKIDEQIESLERMRNEFEVVTNNMAEALVLLSSQGRIISINPSAIRLFNTGDDSIGRDFVLFERSRDIQDAIDDAKKSGHSERTITRRNRAYQIDVSTIVTDGSNMGTVLLAFDITERVNAEKWRRQFTANVSHELKTPLQTITGSAELIEAGIVPDSDMPRFITKIREEAARLVTLIDDIMRLSQLDEGAAMPHEAVDVYITALEVCGQLKAVAHKRGIELYVGGSSLVIYGVPRLLQEIIFNLVENAIKYNVEHGSVTVNIDNDGDNAIIRVQDTGIGITVEDTSRIFERFYRVDKSRSKEIGGTGLGLSIVKHAVEAHGGNISVSSEYGRGTLFTITLPRRAANL